MKRLALGILLACLLGLLASPLAALAQDAVTVLESQAVSDFPNSITFTLKASSSGNITDVRLRYKEDRMACATTIGESILTPAVPRPDVEATWTWDMRRGGLPPGAQVEYWWRIRDMSGKWTDTEHYKFTFEDTGYQWQRLESGNISLMWYRGSQSFAAELLRSAEDALEQLSRDVGVSLQRPTRIYVYQNTADLKGSQVFSREWTGGLAYPDYGVILLAVDPDDTLDWGKRVARHEMAHLVTGQATFNCYGVFTPAWLDEGLATYAEGEFRSDLKAALENGIATNALFSVRSLSGSFPSDYAQALLAYGQSYSIVKYLIDTYGQPKMLAFLESFRTGSSAAQALTGAYGLDLDSLDSRWRAYVGAPPRPSPTPTLTPSPTVTATSTPATESPATTATVTATATTATVTPPATTASSPVPTVTTPASPTPTLSPSPTPMTTVTPTGTATTSTTAAEPSPTPTPSTATKPGGSGCGRSRGGVQSSLNLELLALAGLTLGLTIVRWRRRK